MNHFLSGIGVFFAGLLSGILLVGVLRAPRAAAEQRPRYSARANADVAGYLAVVLSHWAHQDTIMWGRIQALAALQAGTFGAAYTLRRSPLAATAIFVLALVLTSILWLMMQRDAKIHAANVDLMDSLAAGLSRDAFGSDDPRLNLDPPLGWPAPFRLRHLNTAAFVLFAALDVAALIFLIP